MLTSAQSHPWQVLIRCAQVQQMDLLVEQTGLAKQSAQQMENRLRTATEQLSNKEQAISVLKARHMVATFLLCLAVHL